MNVQVVVFWSKLVLVGNKEWHYSRDYSEGYCQSDSVTLDTIVQG